MTEPKDRNKELQNIYDEYNKYCEEIEGKNSKFRRNLGDSYCQKIYDVLFSEVKLKKIYQYKFIEICKLTGMTRPTLSLHLKHLEEKKFITKKVETRYKTFYVVNLKETIKVCKIKKTITGKEKLELTDITKIKTGDEFIPMEPMQLIPIREKSINKKTTRYFKAHKNKSTQVKK